MAMYMKVAALLTLCLVSMEAPAQAISGTNLRSWYEPQKEGDFKMRLIKQGDSIYVFYRYDTSRFDVRWEKRTSYSQRSGDPLTDANIYPLEQRIVVPVPAKPWLLVALITNKADSEMSMRFDLIEANYPVDCAIMEKGRLVLDSYLYENTPYKISGTAPKLKVYCFARAFAPAAAPFSESSVVDPVLEPDSSFTIINNSTIIFTKPGLFLIQSDTNAARGRAILVVRSSYPKLTRVEDLASAMVFISTREEFERLTQAGKDKVKFDKVVLDITRDKDRAKNVIRKYFRRVELANIYFDSYKEGWKTDRGMSYIIFGPPDEVSRTGDTETWTYKKLKSRLVFSRSPSIYDPYNYILQRDKKLMETWYYTIDMWRKNQVASLDAN